LAIHLPLVEDGRLLAKLVKNAFTHMYDAYKDLLSVKPYDPDYKEGYRV
jgi:hypothetical protein